MAYFLGCCEDLYGRLLRLVVQSIIINLLCPIFLVSFRWQFAAFDDTLDRLSLWHHLIEHHFMTDNHSVIHHTVLMRLLIVHNLSWHHGQMLRCAIRRLIVFLHDAKNEAFHRAHPLLKL